MSHLMLTISRMRRKKRPELIQVIDAGRETLRDMEARDVPSELRRVVQSTARNLPVPLQERLLGTINEDEWFRARVAEDFDGVEDADDPYERAAAAFLLRGDAWEQRLEAAQNEIRVVKTSDRIPKLERKIRDLESEVRDWKGSARQWRKEVAAVRKEAERKVRQAWSEAHREVDETLKETCRSQRREIQALRKDLDIKAAQYEEVSSRLTATRHDLERERRAGRVVAPHPALPNVWANTDPIDRARYLDEVVEAVFPGPESGPVRGGETRFEPLELAPGLSPKTPEAVEWLIGLGRPFRLLVDGYNVTGKMYPPDDQPDRFSRPEIRDRLHGDLGELVTRSRDNARITVVWDSAKAEKKSVTRLPTGVKVVYTREGLQADDEIISLAQRHGGTAAVVSSDHRVRDGAERAGSLSLWSEALTQWALNP